MNELDMWSRHGAFPQVIVLSASDVKQPAEPAQQAPNPQFHEEILASSKHAYETTKQMRESTR